MVEKRAKLDIRRSAVFLRRLARDRSANTLALVAAAILPIVGLIGGGVDMSRAYLADSRLQQACDAGVLAARKKLGSGAIVTGDVPDGVAAIGQRFFDVNYQDGIYDTKAREFTMYLEDDFAITGEASVDVPTTLMSVFGYQEIAVDVTCEANMSFSNADILMALDVTGSMRHTNPDDTNSRMETMKQVIRDFHAEMEANKAPDTRVRYGFLPYATNVNVGHLLLDDWVTTEWTYQSREASGGSTVEYTSSYTENWSWVSGSASEWTDVSTYDATWVPPTPGSGGTGDEGGSGGTAGYYTCNGTQPSNTLTADDQLLSTDTEPYAGPPAGTKTTEHRELTEDGTIYQTIRNDSVCTVQRRDYDNLVQTYDRITHPAQYATSNWLYKPLSFDVSNWRTETVGCIEERNTYKITDPNNVDFDTALDLNIDLVPDNSNPATQWRPMYPDNIFVRSLYSTGSGTVTPEEVTSSSTFAQTGTWWFSGCPAPAMALAELDTGTLETYLSGLSPEGATYHDIGMIWAGRMISPTGLFASQNADVADSVPTNRNIIFLTDGETEAFDIAYGAYGVEALDRRRWEEGGAQTLVETVEERFEIACREIRKKNVTVWIIAFGTDVNDSMTRCAGEGRYFEADNAQQLSDAFAKIANSLGDLRITG